MAKKFCFTSLVTIIVLVLSACNIRPTPTPVSPNPVLPEFALELTVSADTSVPFNAPNQVITYTYTVKNTGSKGLAGPVSVVDTIATVTPCPDVSTVGNADATLDPNEQVACTGTYPITQADLDAGTVTNNATASASGTSIMASIQVLLTQNPLLALSKASNPKNYDKVGDVINYTYVITNIGNVTISGTFSIADDKATANCTQPADGALSPNEQMSCTASYSIVQADLDVESVVNTATATNGTITSGSVKETVTNNKSPAGGIQITPDPSLTPNSTVSHIVVKGEWLWQIARCYGADPRQVVIANRGRVSDPAKLVAGMTVTVPNIGSDRTLYGPQKGDDLVSSCAPIYKVKSGDTWENIAGRYLTSASLLKKVNPLATLSPGSEIRIPFNSVGDN